MVTRRRKRKKTTRIANTKLFAVNKTILTISKRFYKQYNYKQDIILTFREYSPKAF